MIRELNNLKFILVQVLLIQIMFPLNLNGKNSKDNEKMQINLKMQKGQKSRRGKNKTKKNT